MKRILQLKSRTQSGHQVLRLLIASYFIAAATGAVPFAAGRALGAIILPEALSGIGFSLFVFSTAFLILIGKWTRGAALLLGSFVFWSSYLASFGPGQTLGYAAFWRDLALIGGLLLTYSDRHTPIGQEAEDRPVAPSHAPEKVVPRRVLRMKKRLRPTTGGTMSAARNHTGYAAFAQTPDEMAMLFSQVMAEE